MAGGAFLKLRIEQVVPRGLQRHAVVAGAQVAGAPLWHSRQTVKTTGRRSSFAFIEPCGLWQVSQPSTRTGGCSKTNGPRLSMWHLRQGCSLLTRLLHHARPLAHTPGGGEGAVRIVAIGALHEAFVDAMLGGHGELRAHGGVAGVAELVLLLGEQDTSAWASGGWSGNWCRPRRSVVCSERRILARERSLAWQSRQVSSACFGRHQGEGARDGGLAAARLDVRLAGPWQPSQPVLSGGSLPEAMLLIVRILEKILPHIGVAGLADIAADEAGPGRCRRLALREDGASQQQQQQQCAQHIRNHNGRGM